MSDTEHKNSFILISWFTAEDIYLSNRSSQVKENAFEPPGYGMQELVQKEEI